MLEGLEAQLLLVICGFVIAFVLAFGIGANDVANSFGTSVGSKVLTLKQACILATIFEILGSILIGAKVSGTIRKGILDPMVFQGSEIELMLGYVSALVGCCVWLILATILNYPVSGTHSIVGATVGMAIVSRGINVIKWKEIIKIVASWFISPLLSGVVSLLMFLLIRRFILRAENPLKAGLKFLPFIYTVTIFVNIGGIVESSPPLLGFGFIPGWGKILMVVVISALVYLGVWLIVVPYMKKKIERTLANATIDEVEQLKLAQGNYNDDMGELTSGGGGGGGGYPNNYVRGGDEQRNVSTQVDYVQLIMSRNEDASRLIDKAYNELEQHQLSASSRGLLNDYMSVDQSMHAGDPHGEVIGPGKKSLIRMRSITAPTSTASKEALDYGDVNLTLRGYLHTIHSPAMRQQLAQKQLNRSSAQAKDRLSITASMTGATSSLTGQHPSSAGNLRENPFARLFAQQKSVAGDGSAVVATATTTTAPVAAAAATAATVDSTVPAVAIAGGSGGGGVSANEKRGRFNLVPASFSQSTATQTSGATPIPAGSAMPADLAKLPGYASLVVPGLDDRADHKSISDNDDEDVEQILDMPTKKEKKEPKIDQYAHTDPPAAAKLFSFLQVLTAIFGSFAHGGNDVSNAIGPLIGLYLIYQEGRISRESSTPEWILFYGGVGISVGLWVLGRRVIKTIGEDLTKITASSGFVIELASALTVLGASLINIPVSTTHCKVGSVVFTGRIRSKESVDWSLFRNIIIAWIVTVPVTGSIAAFCQFMLKLIFNLK